MFTLSNSNKWSQGGGCQGKNETFKYNILYHVFVYEIVFIMFLCFSSCQRQCSFLIGRKRTEGKQLKD